MSWGSISKKLASEIAKMEGKKDESSIGNIREIVSKLTDIIAKEMSMSQSGESVTLIGLKDAAARKAMKLGSKKGKGIKALIP